jgi:N-acetylglucosaminyldiphosphoundecaprenol N-acetyl-beta-D-mannosaminyltransferase
LNLFLFGYFGRRNLGDEAILESFLAWSRSQFPGSAYRALTSSPEETAARHGVEAVAKNDFLSIVRAIKWADAVIAPGGGIFQDVTSARSVIYYAAILRLARLWRRPVFLISQGMGPFGRDWTRKLALRTFRSCVRRLWVRDTGALGRLKEIDLEENKYALGADMAFGFFGRYPREERAVEPGPLAPLRVAVSLRPCEGLERTLGALEGCLLRARSVRQVELTLFAFDNEQDVPVVNRFAEELRRSTPDLKVRIFGSSKTAPSKIPEIFAALSEMDIMLGMRLHSLVFAAMSGTPFVGLCYDPKVKAFAETCGQPMVEDPAAVTPLELDHAIANLTGKDAARARENLKETCRRLHGLLAGSLESLGSELKAIEERKYNVLGIPVSGMSLAATVEKIIGAARARRKLHVATINPEMAMRAAREPEFKKVLVSGALNTTDGVGIRIAVRLKYGRKLDAVTGIDIAESLLERSARDCLRLFLIGGRPEVIERCREQLSGRPNPPLIAGHHHGYLRDVDPEQLRKQIAGAKPDIILAGMGVPLQEYWIRDNMNLMDVPVYIGVGGTFDVWAGATKRAPGVFRKIGLEWLYRAVTDPARLARISVFPIFLAKIFFDAALYRAGVTKKSQG